MPVRIEGLNALASEAGTTPTKYAVAWTLAQPAMASVLIGAKRIEQIEEAVAAADVKLPAEHFAKVDALSPPPWKQPDPVRG